ncbi:MAG: translation elongation factor Ts [Patescibacteria group bacterium]|nr:elongation factor Ts [Patescibacteria group bacterium]MBU2509288.1 elongation factor Ts [Patescibacteria group bacterium]
MIDAKQAMELRQRTGAGILDAKSALEEAGGDMDKAIDILKKKGAAKAAKRGERKTAEGVVACYIHHTNKLGAMVELQCETDFVALNEDFRQLANDIAMQVAAMDPLYLTPEDVPTNDLEKQREIFMAGMAEENKPDDVKEKILAGKLNKWYSEACLTKQAFFKDEDTNIEDLVKGKISTIGENIQIARFVRYQM